MTLLEILVKELPGKGGWPVGANYIAQDSDLSIYGFEERPELEDGHEWLDGTGGGFLLKVGTLSESSDKSTSIITREQYEAALDESKKVAWNGEGLPPVGINCKAFFATDDNPVWYSFVTKFIGNDYVVAMVGMEEICYGKEYISSPAVKFRPIRSEEERKREDSTKEMNKEWRLVAGMEDEKGKLLSIYDVIYDAIAAGKIPHVKIV